MSARTGVLCALRGPAEAAAARGIDADPLLEMTRRCADLPEVLAAAAGGAGSVVVLSTDLPGLDRDAVQDLRACGARTLVVPAEGWSVARAEALDADAVVPPGDPALTVPTAVRELLTRRRDGGRHAPDGARPVPVPGTSTRAPAPASAPTGRVVAVWGPTGAPGRTTLAVNLAAELAELADRRWSTLLVDADTYGGTVAQHLGLLDEAPGIAAAARAGGTGRLDPVALAALSPMLPGGLRVLTGMSRASRWPELPAASLEAVWAAARGLAAWTVVDCGFCLEEDEALSYDTRAPRRNAATLSALGAADVVVVVGAGDPVGMQRLVRGIADLSELGLRGTRLVVVNRVRASASGSHPRDAVREALRRYAGTDARVVVEDQPACDGALLRALTLAEHAPSSPVRRAIAGLATELLSLEVVAGAH